MSTAEESQKLEEEAAKKTRNQAAKRVERRDEKIAQSGFDNEQQVRAALLHQASTNELNDRVQNHNQNFHTVEQRITTLKAELGSLRVSDQELNETEQSSKNISKQFEDKQGKQKSLEVQVKQMKERLQRSAERREKLENEEELLRIHDRLAGDLRSDKFQAYILEEAFTKLVEGASVRLLALTSERYSLRFQDGNILVVDNDNAGETRISSTLPHFHA